MGVTPTSNSHRNRSIPPPNPTATKEIANAQPCGRESILLNPAEALLVALQKELVPQQGQVVGRHSAIIQISGPSQGKSIRHSRRCGGSRGGYDGLGRRRCRRSSSRSHAESALLKRMTKTMMIRGSIVISTLGFLPSFSFRSNSANSPKQSRELLHLSTLSNGIHVG